MAHLQDSPSAPPRRDALLVACLVLACLAGAAGARAADTPAVGGAATAVPATGEQLAPPVQDVRQLPVLPGWVPGDPVIVRPPRVGHGPSRGPVGAETVEPPSPTESRAPLPANFTRFVVDGTAFTGVVPPDTTGGVGPNHFVQAVNASNSSSVAIFNKSGARVAGPFAMSSLFPIATHPCRTSGRGDPVVVFDYQASRWVLMEFIARSAGNTLCLYISNNSNPVTGGWVAYSINTPEFPDYPKLGVAPRVNAYVITVNDSQQRVFAFSRSAILSGAAASGVVFTFPLLSGFDFQSLTPATVSSATLPPTGTPAFVARHRDTEAHGGAAPAGKDLIEVYELRPNYTNPPASTVVLRNVQVPDFNSALCGLTTLDCVPQPGTTRRLDPLREIIMQPLQYRKNGTTQSLVSGFSVDGDGADKATPYWFELRRSSTGNLTFRQGGLFGPSATRHRWLPSLAIDKQGNIAMGFSSSDGAAGRFPSAVITGRLAGDPLNTLREGTSVKAGTGSQTFANRWGDYAATTVDPADNCTFWFTTEYIPANGNWRTTIGAFKFPSCS